ncbi:MAG: Na/Pi cotransporter family protein [Erysipelotrichaceae bacterium]|nr:Na/Pi cotransporter family protein [Erysipelotrichaceae bacterium]
MRTFYTQLICVFILLGVNMASLNWGMILGGFGLFMFGIKFMGDGLKMAAGDSLRDYINRYTSNPFSAMLIGILITIIMQSSSATSAISIGLVRAGLMTLEQAAGIVMGATIGTTVTSFLISINIDRYAMFIIFLGALFICFFKKQKTIYKGQVILGFGLIFFGMSAMGDALAALKELPQFEAFALKMSENPLLAMFAGILLTALVQSSAATIGVAQKLYQAGAITFSASLPFMFGANIGTTMTGILASIGGTVSGKRTACLHTILNVISTTIGMLLLIPFSMLMQDLFGHLNPMMQIAMSNIVFKTVTTLLFIPLIRQIVALTKKIIPEKEEEEFELNVNEMDDKLSNVLPSAAVSASRQAIFKLIDMVRLNLIETQKFTEDNGRPEDKESIDNNEAVINNFDQKITDYLIRLSLKPNLTLQDTADVRFHLDVIKNFERVGDLAINITEFFSMIYEKKEELSDDARNEVKRMFEKLVDMFDLSAEIFATRDTGTYSLLQKMENELDDMEDEFRHNHFDRMKAEICKAPIAESVYCDILGTLERMGDHCCNVGKAAITGKTSDISDDEIIAELF